MITISSNKGPYTREELTLADKACQKVFSSSLLDFINLSEANGRGISISLIDALIAVGKSKNLRKLFGIRD